MKRIRTCAEAVREALDICLKRDRTVFVMGLGVPDPKGVFDTTVGLRRRHGRKRVRDMPVSENAMTGITVGAALSGMRPVLTHQRMDFALLSLDQIVNQAAKWRYMFGGRMKVPLVIRMIVGRGWGQGPQHSQCLHSWFAHVPGLKVVMPALPGDAKGLLISSVEDDNPVIFIEHRWLHSVTGHVPAGACRVPLGRARVLRKGRDCTLVASGHMTLEAMRAAKTLKEQGVSAELVDLRTLKPLDDRTVIASVRRTGRLIVLDDGWRTAGYAAEIVARVCEQPRLGLKAPPRRITMPDVPVPTAYALANHYYPRAEHIVRAVREMTGRRGSPAAPKAAKRRVPLDVPDPDFRGPF